MLGITLSVTTTLKVTCDVPTAFVAVAVTGVVPTLKLEPGAIEYVMVEAGIPTVSVAVYVAIASHEFALLNTLMVPGETIEGATPTTVTLNEKGICSCSYWEHRSAG
jgi:hypothetical protein